MTRKIITLLVDDMTGKEIALGDGETVSLSHDGQANGADLTNENAEASRGLFRDHVSVAFKAGRRSTPDTSANRATANGPSAKKIRDCEGQ